MGQAFQEGGVGVAQGKDDGEVVGGLHAKLACLQLAGEHLLAVPDGAVERGEGGGVDAVEDALEGKDKVVGGDRCAVGVVPDHAVAQMKGIGELVGGHIVPFDDAVGQLPGGQLAHQPLHDVVDHQLFVFLIGKLRVQTFHIAGDVVAHQRRAGAAPAQQHRQKKQQADNSINSHFPKQKMYAPFIDTGGRSPLLLFENLLCKQSIFSVSCARGNFNSNIMKLCFIFRKEGTDGKFCAAKGKKVAIWGNRW